MAYGQAMKDRVLARYDAGDRTHDIAHRYQLSKSWCRRVKQRRYDPPRRIGGSKPHKLDAAGCDALRQWVEQQPDATLEELQQLCLANLQVSISIGALWNTLRRMKLSLKKSR